MATSIHRLDASEITPEQFRAEYVMPQIPLVLGGLQQRWAAREKWGAGYFRARFGDLRVPVRDYDAGAAEGRLYIIREVAFSDYLDYWERLEVGDGPARSPNLYMAEWSFLQQCPELLEDFETPPYFLPDWMDELPPTAQFGRVWLFIGQPMTHTPAHTDTFGTSAWLAMVRGAKVVRMVSPSSIPSVETGTDFFSNGIDARLRSVGVELLEAWIAEGDTLFIPGRWLHQVHNVDKNIMVTKNFVDTPNVLSFLSEFESGVISPIQAMRTLRNRFLKEQLDASGAARSDAPPCLHSALFIQQQLDWANAIDTDIRHYRAQLTGLSRPTE